MVTELPVPEEPAEGEQSICELHRDTRITLLANFRARREGVVVNLMISVCNSCKNMRPGRKLRANLRIVGARTLRNKREFILNRDFESLKRLKKWVSDMSRSLAPIFFEQGDRAEQQMFQDNEFGLALASIALDMEERLANEFRFEE